MKCLLILSLFPICFFFSCKKDPAINQNPSCFLSRIDFTLPPPDSMPPIFIENDGARYTKALQLIGNDSIVYKPLYSSYNTLTDIQVLRYGKLSSVHVVVDPISKELTSMGNPGELSFYYTNGDLTAILSSIYDTLQGKLFVDSVVVEYINHKLIKISNFQRINSITQLLTTYSNFTFTSSSQILPNSNFFITYVTEGLNDFALVRNNVASYDIEYFYDLMKGQMYHVDLHIGTNSNGTISAYDQSLYSYIGCP